MNELEKGQSDDSRTRQYEYRRGYAAAIEEAIEIVSTASCDYEGQSKCIEKLEALLAKGTK